MRGGELTVSINGADNVGKTTHIGWLARAIPAATNVGTVDRWNPEWKTVTEGDFARWWFSDSTTPEHVRLIFESHAARRAASGKLALEDRGHPMLVAVCAATAAVKEQLSPELAMRRVAELLPNARDERPELHILLRHASDPFEEAALALVREGSPSSRWYADYQRNLALVLNIQTNRGEYRFVVDRGDRSILEVQNYIRRYLANQGLTVDPLPANQLRRLWVLAGMSESGKSTVGDLLRSEHAATRLKIGYLLDVAASRAGITDPYAEWDERIQAEKLAEEILRFSHANKAEIVSVESAHRYEATLHLKKIFGSVCHIVYVDADHRVRQERSEQEFGNRDHEKAERGADRIAKVADFTIDNNHSLAALKFAVGGMARDPDCPRPLFGLDIAHGPLARSWILQTVQPLIDPEVAAILVTGSATHDHWKPGWSDVDLLIVRDSLPAGWIRRHIAHVPGVPADTKLAISLFTSREVMNCWIPPRVIHALRLAVADGRGILHLRRDFRLPDHGPAVDDKASREELPLVVMTLRRLIAATRSDARALYKHVILVMKILLRADGINADNSDDVISQFLAAHPRAGVVLPSLADVTAADWRTDVRLADRLIDAADSILRYHDALSRTVTFSPVVVPSIRSSSPR